MIKSSIDEAGVSLPYAIVRQVDDSITMMALALEPEQSYQAFFKAMADLNAVEGIFALDRFTRDNQGTKYKDVMAVRIQSRRRSSSNIVLIHSSSNQSIIPTSFGMSPR